MTFLKKLGSIIQLVSGLFLGFAPTLTKALPGTTGEVTTISKDLTDIGNVVVEVEAFGQLQGLSGADKAKAAGPLVAQIILNSSLVAGKKIANPVLFQQANVEIAGGVADLLNSLHEDSVATVTQKTS